jgi:hypothetical protein
MAMGTLIGTDAALNPIGGGVVAGVGFSRAGVGGEVMSESMKLLARWQYQRAVGRSTLPQVNVAQYAG